MDREEEEKERQEFLKIYNGFKGFGRSTRDYHEAIKIMTNARRAEHMAFLIKKRDILFLL